jgi:transcription antitermination factor NusG
MPLALAAKDQWYVVHVLSGQENKVKDNIEKRVKTEEMTDVIYEVLVPTERVSEIKKGKKSETTRKFFPGYLIVNMHLLDQNNQLVDRTWYFIKDTPGVIGFAGTKDKPIPMRQSEVESMLAQMKEREFHLKSARQSRWLMDRSKTRTVLLKKLTRNGASYGFPSPSLVALRPSNWNIGRWNEAKSEVRRTFRFNEIQWQRK